MPKSPATRTPAELRPDINIDTAIIMDHAFVELANRRFARRLDPPTQLHLLASLIAQADIWVGEQVAAARADGATWATVGRLLGTTATAARQRWTTRGPTSQNHSTPLQPPPRRHSLRAPMAD